ncbi:hypothetical protein KKG83_02865 [Candidatus Micrarchaeota archaeon]|nr:hypothetical protein [Candidatus Micrarchaeota archaeon]MBU2476387.1 hypothetical protein [Candidatus Micrarchaeota archaeon]
MKKSKAKKFGIEIIYKPPIDTAKDYQRFSAIFYSTSNPSSENFISNRRISKAIRKDRKELSESNSKRKLGYIIISNRKISKAVSRKNRNESSELNHKEKMGYITATIDHDNLVWNDYYPLFYAPAENLRHKGIANLLELLLLKEVKKKCPKIKYVYHFDPSNSRITQVNKRRLDVSREYTIKEAISKLEKKINSDRRKARQRVSLAKRIKANRKNPKTRRTKQIKRMQLRMAA